eukprot:111759-Prorocentrum_lima.AAC.1
MAPRRLSTKWREESFWMLSPGSVRPSSSCLVSPRRRSASLRVEFFRMLQSKSVRPSSSC